MQIEMLTPQLTTKKRFRWKLLKMRVLDFATSKSPSLNPAAVEEVTGR